MQERYRNSAANGGQLPGLPEERAPAGLAIAIAVVMALAVPRSRLGCRCPLRAAGPHPWPGGCGCGTGDTMNVLAADELEAADVLALARLDDDGVPPVVTPPPARDAKSRHPIRLAGAGQVTTGQAEWIAAAPGRARQQLTPALSASASAAHSPPSACPWP